MSKVAAEGGGILLTPIDQDPSACLQQRRHRIGVFDGSDAYHGCPGAGPGFTHELIRRSGAGSDAQEELWQQPSSRGRGSPAWPRLGPRLDGQLLAMRTSR